VRYLKVACALALLAAFSVPARAGNLPKVIQIGVLNDMSSTQAAADGMGAAVAAKIAVEEFGGKVHGVPVEVLAADTQNKPDIGVEIVRRWLDQGVSAFVDGGGSATTLASQAVVRERDRPFFFTSQGSMAFTNEACAATNLHFTNDAYSLGKTLVSALMPQADSWYFITANYAGGISIETAIANFVKAAGGKVLGSSRHPIGEQDFSSYLLQAQASKAKVIASVNFVQDLVNTLKQANEFGIGKDGTQSFAIPLVYMSDIKAVGLDAMPPLVTGMAFYWDFNDETRAFAKKFAERYNGAYPDTPQIGAYVATLHYLKALDAVGDVSGKLVVAKMKELPVNDAFENDVKIREDGRVLHPFHLMRLKTPAESKAPYDDFKLVKTISPEDAYQPLSESTCPLVKK
jgi:branched-chain amino acid transport system substrate-binding protein